MLCITVAVNLDFMGTKIQIKNVSPAIQGVLLIGLKIVELYKSGFSATSDVPVNGSIKFVLQPN